MKCLKCDSEFTPKRSNSKYCSYKCGNSAAKKREYEKRKQSGFCYTCGVNLRFENRIRCINCIEKHSQCEAKRRTKRRRRFIETYGGKCTCCGLNNWQFLTLDHIEDDGSVDRNVRSDYQIYNCAINNYQPNRYQVLCANCNCAKQWYGECPHKEGGVF